MKKLPLLFLLLFFVQTVRGQNDLLNELEKQDSVKWDYTYATFKGTRVVNGQSVEGKKKGELEFIFSHRFGRINEGSYTLWGLDDSYVRLGLEYGITNRLSVSLARTSVDKTFDGFARYKLLRQTTGGRSIPISITALGNMYYKSSPSKDEDPNFATSDRLAYGAQLLIARKFSPKLSLQLNPIFIHRNAVQQEYENNNDVALGFAGRYKITRSLALTGEYFLRLNEHENSPYYDAVGFGIDIETGGHVFQLVFTNSRGMFERATVAETEGNFFGGDVHFGFNISRTFQIAGKK
jgi:hypothetical protein